MKRSLTLALLLTIAGTVALMAAPVSPERARQIATTFVKAQRGASSQLTVSGIERVRPELYMVHFSPRGYAVVSADDTSAPVIAYSLESSIDSEQMPDAMAYMLTDASNVIGRTAATVAAPDHRWAEVESGDFIRLSRAGSDPIDELIKVNWNQGSPYNDLCPGSGSTKAVVGCVAVAMSQAMSVQQFPSKPMGSVSYVAQGYGTLKVNYDAEEPYDWKKILTAGSTRDYSEVSRLLYHAGVSVHMDYGADGSGIPSNQVYRITNALRDNFGYGNDVAYHWRSDYPYDWEELLLNELNAGRAIVYNAIDSKGGYGHSFNIDGYDGRRYHVNWGWGGYGNGYFLISNLSDTQMGMNYDSKHVAVVGIGRPDTPLRSVGVTDLAIEAGQPRGTTVSFVLVNGELPTSNMVVNVVGAYDSTTGRNKEIPVEYRNGRLVTTREISADEGSFYAQISVAMSDAPNVRLVQAYTFTVEPQRSIQEKTGVSYDRATATFTVRTKFDSTYTLRNAQGQTVTTGTLDLNPVITFQRSQLTQGINTLEIKWHDQTWTVKIKI